ncbi:MAG: ammonium transporter [bacterium]|jgi:ammonium transporter
MATSINGTLDIIWILICTGLVIVMQAGFCCLESGLVRSKNSINVAIKNLADFCVVSLIFWMFGFALMFGDSYGGWIGVSGFFVGNDSSPRLLAFFLFQLVFCGTATTIISGAVAERMKFAGYLLIAIIVSAFIYPVIGHWIWGGTESQVMTGWLAKIGFIDFAGSTVVHSTGGWVALAAIILIGPRLGRFTEKQSIAGHNLPMSTLGVFLLWFGWFGFNGGSTFSVSKNIPLILVNTSMSAVLGGVTGIILSWNRFHQFKIKHIINGCLAGLVSITASCHIMTPLLSGIIGIVGSLICFGVTHLLERFKIDDVVGAVSVHCGGGVWGTLAVALLGNPTAWGGGRGRWEQLMIQAVGVGACFLWSFGLSFILLWLINRYFSLRVSLKEELIGLNISEHGASSALLELLTEMEEHRESGDFSQAVTVEPHTEVGQIAEGYNRVALKFVKEKENILQANQQVQDYFQKLKNEEQQKKEAYQILETKNQELENLSSKLSKYLPPQVCESILSGGQDVKLESYRKKITVLFSRISDFNEITDTMESEALTQVLNDYFNYMSSIAQVHGAIVDRFVGDSIVIFFDESTDQGTQNNAISCVKMAIEMQNMMVELRKKWDFYGISKLLRIRIGINTGYCTVGNFGSEDRMSYTVIGGEVNLAHQIENYAKNDQILISHETHALVKEAVYCKKGDSKSVKGIAHPVQLYEAVSLPKEVKNDLLSLKNKTLENKGEGFSFFFDFEKIPKKEKVHLIKVLSNLLKETKLE